MPRTNPLLVLIVRDPATRSTLTAQLSMGGHELVTLSRVHDPSLQQPVRSRSILVIDGAMVGSQSSEWTDLLLEGWWRVLLLGAGGVDSPTSDAAHRSHVEPADLSETLAALAEAWRADASRGSTA